MLFPVSAFAVSAELNSAENAVEVGDELVVEVDFREKGIGAVFASFTYNPRILEFTEGEGAAAADGRGTIVLYSASSEETHLHTELHFMAMDMGDAEINLTVKEAISFDEQPLETADAEISVRVLRSADAYVIVESAGERMQALCKLPYLPEGYTKEMVEIAGKKIEAAVSGQNVFVYLVVPSREEGGFYLRENGEYRKALEMNGEYILLPGTEEGIPEGFVRETFRIGEVDYKGYSDGTRYLVKALQKGSEAALYFYDPSDGSLQKYHEDVLTEQIYTEAEVEYNYKRPLILGGIFVLLLIGIVITAIVKRER